MVFHMFVCIIVELIWWMCLMTLINQQYRSNILILSGDHLTNVTDIVTLFAGKVHGWPRKMLGMQWRPTSKLKV